MRALRLDAATARQRFAGRGWPGWPPRPGGRPHLVPFTFALDRHPGPGDRIYSAVDAKPKSTTDLRRLRNIRANPRVAVLAHHYEDDLGEHWWVAPTGPTVVRAPPLAPSPCWPPVTPSTPASRWPGNQHPGQPLDRLGRARLTPPIMGPHRIQAREPGPAPRPLQAEAAQGVLQ